MVAITEKLSLQSQDGRTHGMMYGYPWRGIQTYSNHPGFVTILVYVTHENNISFGGIPNSGNILFLKLEAQQLSTMSN
jgi:hypothetical protein